MLSSPKHAFTFIKLNKSPTGVMVDYCVFLQIMLKNHVEYNLLQFVYSSKFIYWELLIVCIQLTYFFFCLLGINELKKTFLR